MAQEEGDTEGKPAALSWFTRSTRRYTHLIIELMVIAIVIRLIGLVQPFVFQTLIDRVLPFQRVSSLQLILYILLGTTLFSVALGILSGLLGTQLANRLTSEMGRRIYDHSLKLPLLRLQRFSVGEQLARIAEIDTVRGFLTGTIADIVLDLLFVIIYIAALLSLSPFLTMIVLILLPLQMVGFGVIGPFLRARLQDSFQAGAHHQSGMVEAYGNPVTIKSVGAEDEHRNRVSQTLDFSLFQGWRVAKLNIANGAIGELLGGISVILVIYFGAQLVFVSELTLGQLIAFHLLAEKVAGPIFSLSTIWEKWQGLRIARLRLGDLLNPKAESESGLPKLPDMTDGRLSVSKLTFGYAPDVPVLNNISLDARPGVPTIIVGDSGCGKSTLAKLLCGLYPPWEGQVALDEHGLQQHDPFSVRRHIGYVAQEPVLFVGSVLENLQMASASATPEEIDAVLKDSACEFVQRLPEGINTQVGERGQNLSGGQRQRLAVARSLLTKPEVLVLDEPTSSLDEASAQAVMRTLQQLAKTKTIILITHRPDLIEGRKRVIDLNQIQAHAAELPA